MTPKWSMRAPWGRGAGASPVTVSSARPRAMYTLTWENLVPDNTHDAEEQSPTGSTC